MNNASVYKPSFRWSHIEAVIFDVDGTLYDQRRLRRKMMACLLLRCSINPWHWREVKVIKSFRTVREEIADGLKTSNLENEQYRITAKRTGVAESDVRRCVEEWIFKRPLAYLKDCRFPFLFEFLEELEKKKIRLAYFSDYPSQEKIKALGLPDVLQICSTAQSVDAFKPDPKGLLRVIERLEVSPAKVLYIGDRDERDGECARRLNVAYLIKAHKVLYPWEFKGYKSLLQDLQRHSF